MLELIKKYFISLSGGPPAYHRADSTLLLMVGSVFAGYTATAFPDKFLKKFENPILQFVVFLILGLSTSLNGSNVKLYVIGDAIITTIIFQILIYISKKYADNQENSEDS